MNNWDKPILIVSPPRSGSSLTSLILTELGLWGGNMKKGDRWNKNGYYENIAITSLLIDYLRENDKEQLLKKYNPLTLDADYYKFDLLIKEILYVESLPYNEKWFYKNPKIAFCWQLFNKYFPNAQWIIVKRNRNEILNSILRTEFMDAYKSVNEWNNYLDKYEILINNIKSNCNYTEFNINNVFDNKISEVKKLCYYLDIEYNEKWRKLINKKEWNNDK
jgi:hypothetical protein|tara:strand:- start:1200 stop:1859 length:660 start_codon:yes stop_codon:yes gene_type:complete